MIDWVLWMIAMNITYTFKEKNILNVQLRENFLNLLKHFTSSQKSITSPGQSCIQHSHMCIHTHINVHIMMQSLLYMEQYSVPEKVNLL